MYVLLYINSLGAPVYIQAETLELLNQQVLTIWEQDDIDQDAWEDCQLLYSMDDKLISLNRWDCERVPQFTLY
jgi:hypothetical protein